MTSRDDGPESADLDLTDDPRLGRLLEGLRGVAQSADAPPGSVLTAASAAFELRDLDAELAALIADSLTEQSAELVRGSTSTRQLTFEAPGFVVQLQVTSTPSGRRLVGQVSGPPAGGGPDSAAGAVRVEHSGGLLDVRPDAHGRFLVEHVPSGNLRLRVTGPGGRSTVTAWVNV